MKKLIATLVLAYVITLPSLGQTQREKTIQSMSRLGQSFLPQKKAPTTEEKPAVQKVETAVLPKENPVITSDVARSIPCNTTRNEKSFAVIIANQSYQRESEVECALNDGRIFSEYCNKTLGIPSKNIHIVENATINNMKYELSWLERVCEAYKDDSVKVVFYYAGHGIPDESTKSAYLLAIDSYSADPTTGLKLTELYDRLGALHSAQVVLFMDACFSGATRNDKMLTAARGVAIAPKKDVPSGNLIVFSASLNDQTAYSFKEKGHGLFTYYVLKALQQSDGNMNMGDLADYVTSNVSKVSIIENEKPQTPSLTTSINFDSSWRNLRLH